VARIALSDCLTASGIVAAWRARSELLGGTVFPITKSALILLFWFLCPLNSSQCRSRSGVYNSNWANRHRKPSRI